MLSVRAMSTMAATRAVIVCAKVDCFAAERAAVVDELLAFLGGHYGCGWWGLGVNETKKALRGQEWKTDDSRGLER
jgi:hypothetical protein